MYAKTVDLIFHRKPLYCVNHKNKTSGLRDVVNRLCRWYVRQYIYTHMCVYVCVFVCTYVCTYVYSKALPLVRSSDYCKHIYIYACVRVCMFV